MKISMDFLLLEQWAFPAQTAAGHNQRIKNNQRQEAIPPEARSMNMLLLDFFGTTA